MHIDTKSFILGAVVGYCFILYRASVAVAKDKVNEKLQVKEA